MSYKVLIILLGSIATLSETCEKAAVENIVFLGFQPCFTRRNQSSFVTKEDLDECDVLVSAAFDLAAERINARCNDQSIFTNRCLEVLQLPDNSDSDEVIDLEPVINAFRNENFVGLIGPSTASVAEFWAQLFYRANLLTVTYNVTASAPNYAPSFYRTLPSERAGSIGRVVLTIRNSWLRIATITSDETFYIKQAEEFLVDSKELLHQNNVELAMMASFSASPVTALREMRRNGINIIFAFFGPGVARNVMCQAYLMGLVSHDHVWVLPAYYSPNWWRATNASASDSNCTVAMMKNILESVIFIDTVKIPPVNVPLDEFHSQLVSKALALFPSLTEEDLQPYLLRSRASNAYDAVTLLAESVDMSFRVRGNSYADTEVIQEALENIFLACEYCRIHSGCFLNLSINEQCERHCPTDLFNLTSLELADLYTNLSHVDGLRRDHLLHSFGQILFYQFIDGEECPVGLLWTSGGYDQSLVVREQIYTLDELDGVPCALSLNISKELFVREGSRCPLTFQWRGSEEPPSSHALAFLTLSLTEIIIISLLTLLGLVLAPIFLVFNLVYRRNKIVKASSPWLNVIVLIGIIVCMPSSMFESLIISSEKFGFSMNLDPLCYFSILSYYLGQVIFVVALLAKSWRIHLIFYNKHLKFYGNRLSDERLIIGILIFVMLMAILLIVWCTDNIHQVTTIVPEAMNPPFKVTYCYSTHFDIFKGVASLYNIFLLLTLFIVTVLSLNSSMKIFHRESRLSYLAVSIIIFPIVIIDIINSIAETNMAYRIEIIHVLVWIHCTSGVLVPGVIMLVLFLPNMYQVMLKEIVMSKLNSFWAKNKLMKQPASDELSDRYHSLRAEVVSLKNQLTKTNNMIDQLLEEGQQPKNNSPTECRKTTPTEDANVTPCSSSVAQCSSSSPNLQTCHCKPLHTSSNGTRLVCTCTTENNVNLKQHDLQTLPDSTLPHVVEDSIHHHPTTDEVESPLSTVEVEQQEANLCTSSLHLELSAFYSLSCELKPHVSDHLKLRDVATASHGGCEINSDENNKTLARAEHELDKLMDSNSESEVTSVMKLESKTCDGEQELEIFKRDGDQINAIRTTVE